MKLFYRQYGKGKPLIILHGLFGLSDNWVSHGKRLAEQFSVFLVDLRNHGQSPHSPSFNYYTMVDDLYEFIEDHKLNKPIIIGHSMGGKVAMNFALSYPEMIDKLVVIDISPAKYPERNAHFNIINAMMSINFEAIHNRDEVSKILETSISSEKIRLFIMKNLYRKTRHTFDWRLNLSAIYNNIDNIFDGIELDSVNYQPALFIRGSLSDYIKDSDEKIIKKFFPNAKIETIAGVGHWVHAEAPKELCNLFSSFFEKPCTYEE